MKVSYNWLKQLIALDETPEEMARILTMLGLEVSGFEHFENIKGGLEGIVTGIVTSCHKHPNADKLSLTTVDIGQRDKLQIVCGAPNVAKDQKVLVATVGTTLYTPEGESWIIKKTKIRGEVSEGMICAEDEVGLGTSHEGIMVLPDSTEIGIQASTLFDVTKDVVFDIDLTPNRSDATAHLGVARDLLAYQRFHGESKAEITVPGSDFQFPKTDKTFHVEVENNEACPRFTGIVIDNLNIQESPNWLKVQLEAIGVRPINNVVDITNLVLHELGQPLHAYDYEKIGGEGILVTTLPNGTVFKSLDEVDRTLSDHDLMVCDALSQPMCIGGVFGGINSGVTDGTTKIFLEAAHFNAKWISRSSKKHLLFTDAAKIFEKGSDPNMCIPALQRAAQLLGELANGKVVSELVDIKSHEFAAEPISVRFSKINAVIGNAISPTTVTEICEALDLEILDSDEAQITVRVGTNKADVVREIDVIEEILRIYGYDEVILPSQMNLGVNNEKEHPSIDLKNEVANYLKGLGYAEIMGLSLVSNDYFPKRFANEEQSLVRIHNTSNSHIEVMRPNMMVTMLETIEHNQNRQMLDCKLFEFGHTYEHKSGKFIETEYLTIGQTGRRFGESWLIDDTQNFNSFFDGKGVVEALLKLMNIEYDSTYDMGDDDELFGFGHHYKKDGQLIASVGMVSQHLLQQFDIRNEIAFAQINWKKATAYKMKQSILFEPISKYPKVRRDLALVMHSKISYAQVEKVILQVGPKSLKDIVLFDEYINKDVLGPDKKSYAIGLIFESHEKTMSDDQIDQAINKILRSLKHQLQVALR